MTVYNLYSYIYMKIKKENDKILIVNISSLKETIGRVIVRKGGVPRFMIKYVIDDLMALGLIERVSYDTYKIVESNYDRRIKQLAASYC